MSECQGIVSRILSDANAVADSTRAEANDNAAKTLEKCGSDVKKYVAAQAKAKDEAVNNLISRRQTAAKLDGNKIMLEAKQKVLDRVYSSALATLCALSKDRYVAFIGKLLEKYAEEGDTVVLSEKCAFTDAVSTLPVFSQRSLKLAPKRGHFAGGVVVNGKKCDINLTFEALVAERRDFGEAKISEELFG